MTKLNQKQELFIREYLVDLNATQAAIRAGYSRNGAQQTGWNNLKIPAIQKALTEYCAPRLEKADINVDYVLDLIKTTTERCAVKVEGEEDKFYPLGVFKGTDQMGKYLKMFTTMNETKFTGDVDHDSMSHEELMAYRATLVTQILQNQPNNPKK